MSYLATANINSLKSKLSILKNVNQAIKPASDLKSIFIQINKNNIIQGLMLRFFLVFKRTFLTESYYCYEQWDKFLMSDIMKKAGTGNFR
jgi:hypothetical protein